MFREIRKSDSLYRILFRTPEGDFSFGNAANPRFHGKGDSMNIATQAAQIGMEWDSRTGAVTVPIYQTATFRHPGLGQSTGYDYTRSGNPTRQALEEGMARLDNGCRGFAYSTGMAAITSLLLLFRHGDHLVVTEDLYGGTYRLFEKIFQQYGLEFSYVDTSDTGAVEAAIRPNTRAL